MRKTLCGVLGLGCILGVFACSGDDPGDDVADGAGVGGSDDGNTGGDASGGAGSGAGSIAVNEAGAGGSRDGAGGTSGGTGGSAGTGDSGGNAGSAGADPIDWTGLLPTSGRHVVFAANAAIATVADELLALDVDSGVLHELNPDHVSAITKMPSPDGKALVFGGLDPDELYVARFSADGLVPGRPVGGWGDLAGSLSTDNWRLGEGTHLVWTDDARFLALSRSSGLDNGIELVDVWSAARHVGFAKENGGFGVSDVTVAPHGRFFKWSFDVDDSPLHSYAQLTEDGSTSEVALGPDATAWMFDAEGMALIWSQKDPSGASRVFRRELSSGDDTELQASVAGAVLYEMRYLDPDGAHVDALYMDSGTGDQHTFWVYRLTTDGSTPPVMISDPEHDTPDWDSSADGRVKLFIWVDQTANHVEASDASGGHRLSLGTHMPGAGYLSDHSALGEHHVYYQDSGAIAHVVALGADGAPIDTPLHEASEGGASCLAGVNATRPGQNELAIGVGATGIVMLDLSAPVPVRKGMLANLTEYGELGCPVWAPRGDGFGYVERTPSYLHTLYLVDWSGADPSPPQQVFQSQETRVAGLLMVLP